MIPEEVLIQIKITVAKHVTEILCKLGIVNMVDMPLSNLTASPL